MFVVMWIGANSQGGVSRKLDTFTLHNMRGW